MQMIEANWVAFVVAILAVLIVGWLIFRKATKPRVRSYRPDVLDDGAAPASRNQALIDAPPAAASADIASAAAAVAATGPDVMMGMGEVAAAAVVEEIQASAPPPAPEPAPTPGGADDLRRIKGVGPKLVTMLHGLGITRYAQIAGWSQGDVERIDAQLGTFAGRIERDSWIEQAKFLASGDTAGFEGKFGKL